MGKVRILTVNTDKMGKIARKDFLSTVVLVLLDRDDTDVLAYVRSCVFDGLRREKGRPPADPARPRNMSLS